MSTTPELRVRYRTRFAVHFVFTVALAIITAAVDGGTDLHDHLHSLTLISVGMALMSWITLKDFT